MRHDPTRLGLEAHRRGSRARALLGILLAAAILPACGNGGGTGGPVRPDLVIVTVDTLRADRLGLYGNRSIRTPNLDALAERAVLFQSAMTPSPRTTPALASLFTGKWPHRHGSREVMDPLRHGPLLAEVLRREGYWTSAVSANRAAGPATGIERGFEAFVSAGDLLQRRGEPWRQFLFRLRLDDQPATAADRVTRRALDLAKAAPPDRPLFLWVHYSDPHFPYAPPASWTAQPEAVSCRELQTQVKDGLNKGLVFNDSLGMATRALEDCLALYDAEIEYTDAAIGELLGGLAEIRDLDRSFTVFTSDHGENFGEGGVFFEHGPTVHEAAIRVPLLMLGPGLLPGGVDEEVVGLEDLMPTLLDLLGFASERWPTMDGSSIAARLKGEPSAPDAHTGLSFAESCGALRFEMTAQFQSGRTGRRHCINAPRFSLCRRGPDDWKLFDRLSDPQMSVDVGAEFPREYQELRRASEHWPPETARQRSVRSRRFKLVERPTLAGTYERLLFDIQQDPDETLDVSPDHPATTQFLAEELARFAAELKPYTRSARSPDQLEALRALGYVN